MNPDSIFVLIPLAPFLLGGLVIWTRHSRRMAELRANDTAERAAQYATRNQSMEERLRVLERIVTDKGYDVATQIEALRDVRSVESQDSGRLR